MRQTACLSLLAGAAVSFGGANVAAADEAWTSSNADEVRALVAEMVADADSRSSLLQSGGAGHDGKFFLGSPDGNFRMNVGGQVQFRYILNFTDDVDDDPLTPQNEAEDDFEPGFQTRRTKLNFGGHVFNPDLFYYVQGAFDRSAGGTFRLEDAYVGMNLDGGLSVRWGQFKAPLLREELVSSKRQLAAERSIVNEFFSQNRSQGIELAYADEMWRVKGMFSDGLNSANTDIGTESADWGLTARGEFLASGQWDQFDAFTSERGSEMGVMVGGALHWQDGPDRPTGPAETSVFQYTIDASVAGDGWNLFGAFIGRSSDPDGAQSRDDFGYVIQGGWYLSEEFEIFGRWDHLLLDDDFAAEDDFQTVTAGVNYYLHGHAAKFTVDLNWYLDSSADAFGPGAAFSGLGHLASSEDDQVAIRAQFQLLF